MNTVEELEQLSVEEFGDELKEVFGDLTEIQPFLDPRVFERSYEYLVDLQGSLEDQIAKYAPRDNGDWLERTESMHRLVSHRLALVQRRIRANDRKLRTEAESGDGTVATAKQWRAFAHELVALIVDHGSDQLVYALEDIQIPQGGLNAGEWFDVRIAKRARLAPVTMLRVAA